MSAVIDAARTSWMSPGGWDELGELVSPQWEPRRAALKEMCLLWGAAGLLTLQGELRDTGFTQVSWSSQVPGPTEVSLSGSYLGDGASNICATKIPLHSERGHPLRSFEIICREFQASTGKGPEQTDPAWKLALLSAGGWAGDFQPFLPTSGFFHESEKKKKGWEVQKKKELNKIWRV